MKKCVPNFDNPIQLIQVPVRIVAIPTAYLTLSIAGSSAIRLRVTILLFFFLSLIVQRSFGQETPTLEWAKNFGGSSTEGATSVKTDATGNVYVAGYFNSPSVDFDPGPGSVNLSSMGSDDTFISKFDANGNLLWARALGGTSPDYITDIEIDNSGNVYATGYFGTTVDFDPGVGTFSLTSAGSYDAFVLKAYFQW